jgi:uncharacterized protein involved in response to NO
MAAVFSLACAALAGLFLSLWFDSKDTRHLGLAGACMLLAVPAAGSFLGGDAPLLRALWWTLRAAALLIILMVVLDGGRWRRRRF